jgi:hypothetical protein
VAGDGVGHDILAFGVGVGGGREAPAFVAHVPVHGGDGDERFQAFEFAGYDGAICLGRMLGP